jgi:hypothetical protein
LSYAFKIQCKRYAICVREVEEAFKEFLVI